jgi:hypothetical protein
MVKGKQKQIEVWADWVGMKQPIRIGTLYASPGRGHEIFSFEYEAAWLRSPPWPKEARALKLSKDEQDRIASAFRVADGARADFTGAA